MIILITLIGIVMVWKRVYNVYKTCYIVRNTYYGYCYTKTKATLKQFKDLYYVSPDKFILEDQYPYYFFEHHGKSQKVIFHFSFIDWIKYLIWKDYAEKEERKNKERQEANKQQEKDNEVLKAMYESLLRDIDKTRKQGEKYIEQARKTIMKVNQRMGYYRRG